MNYHYDFTFGRRNKIIGPSQLVSAANIFTPTAAQKYTLGLELDLNDATHRRFVYCKNGATALGKSKMVQTPAHDAESIASTIQTGNDVAIVETSRLRQCAFGGCVLQPLFFLCSDCQDSELVNETVSQAFPVQAFWLAGFVLGGEGHRDTSNV